MNIELDIAEESLDDIVCTSLKKFIRSGYVEDKKLLKAMERVLEFYIAKQRDSLILSRMAKPDSVHEDYVDFIDDLKGKKI
tara:strand:- start:27061 stop:27303 length:243 start_codon:yes stop_codon:yes gene_type:complete